MVWLSSHYVSKIDALYYKYPSDREKSVEWRMTIEVANITGPYVIETTQKEEKATAPIPGNLGRKQQNNAVRAALHLSSPSQ